MKTVLAKLLALVLAFMLTGCSNTPDDEPESRFDVYSFIDFGLTLQDTLVHSYESDLNLTSELVEDTYIMMDSFEKVADSVITSGTLTAEFINLLAKNQTFKYDWLDRLDDATGTYGALIYDYDEVGVDCGTSCIRDRDAILVDFYDCPSQEMWEDGWIAAVPTRKWEQLFPSILRQYAAEAVVNVAFVSLSSEIYSGNCN